MPLKRNLYKKNNNVNIFVLSSSMRWPSFCSGTWHHASGIGRVPTFHFLSLCLLVKKKKKSSSIKYKCNFTVSNCGKSRHRESTKADHTTECDECQEMQTIVSYWSRPSGDWHTVQHPFKYQEVANMSQNMSWIETKKGRRGSQTRLYTNLHNRHQNLYPLKKKKKIATKADRKWFQVLLHYAVH